jgi:ABC-type oligopeptide transport system ATPase subunit
MGAELVLTDVSIRYKRHGHRDVQAVDHLDLRVAPGEVVGLVGESGCGKSTLARAICGLERFQTGTATFGGTPIVPLSLRRRPASLLPIQMVFQNPNASLNPRRPIGLSCRIDWTMFVVRTRHWVGERIDELTGVGVLGPGEDVEPGAGLHDAAAAHHRDGVRDGGQHREVVRDEERAEAEVVGEPPQQAQDPCLDRDVERGRRLVGDEDAGFTHQGRGDRDPLELTSAELVRVSPKGVRRVRHLHPVEEVKGPVACLASRQAQVVAGMVGELGADAQEGMEG